MNGAQMETKNEALRSPAYIRCAKSAWILHSLNKSSANRQFKTRTDEEKDLMKMMMLKEIEDLKIRVAKERIKNKRMKLCGITEVILQILVVFFTSFVVDFMLDLSIGLI